MRSLILILAGLLLAGTAAAQVAAPSLNPTPTLSFAPGNPAVLPWDGPSRVGIAYGKREQDVPGAPVSPVAEGDVTSLNAQWVGETFAAGAAIVSLTDDVDPLFGGGQSTIDAQVWGVAAQFAETYTMGLAYEKVTIVGPPVAPGDETETTPLFGGTARFGAFYVGISGGTGTREDNLSPPDEVQRAMRNYGLAYYWREKGAAVHAEYYRGQRDAAVDLVSGYNTDEEVISGFTLEAIYSDFLFGYQSQSNELTDFLGAAVNSQDLTTITLGYVPAPGWSFVVAQFDHDTFDAAGVSQGSASTTSVGVTLSF